MTTPAITTYAVRANRHFVAVHVHPAGQCYASTAPSARARSGELQVFVPGTDVAAIRTVAMTPSVKRYQSLGERRSDVFAKVVRAPEFDVER